MPASFCSRLLIALSDFIHALALGGDSLFKFYKECSALMAELQHASSRGLLQPEDISLLSAIKTVASASVQMEIESEESLCAMLEDMALSPSGDFEITISRWFSSHCHDPYPTKADKEHISQLTGASLKRIDSWMANARKSTGWTTLCQGLFSGSRSATVRASRCVYLGDSNAGDVSPEVAYALLVVKANAERLVFDAEKRVIERIGCQSITALFGDDASSKSGADEYESLQKRGNTCCQSTDAGPSAILSDSSDTSCASEDEEDTTPPPPVAGSKRQRTDGFVVSKRPRTQRASSNPSHCNYLSSVSSNPRRSSMPTTSLQASPLKTSDCTITLSNGASCSSTDLINISPPIVAGLPMSLKRPALDVVEGIPRSKRQRALSVLPQSSNETKAFSSGLAVLQSLDCLPDLSGIPCGPDISGWCSSLSVSGSGCGQSFGIARLDNPSGSAGSVSKPSVTRHCSSPDSTLPMLFGDTVGSDDDLTSFHGPNFINLLDPFSMSLPSFAPPPTSDLTVLPGQDMKDVWDFALDDGFLQLLNAPSLQFDALSNVEPILPSTPAALSSSVSDSSSEVVTPKSDFAQLQSGGESSDIVAEIARICATAC
ncbi:hypothetical protein K488DRAFT_71414 [Vararia minispora EC-137]|uniref:Uncharacterized protein n=1 Tax=Vararia minispora EC-137 TaxID=1314806 RepID=A0ACB8QII4_9AGAM|nr:hypothetical protein K488DRAFT_71414 [Vararia minispora EC-137]